MLGLLHRRYSALINSKARLTYKQVEGHIKRSELLKDVEVVDSIHALEQLTTARLKIRQQRHALEINPKEAILELATNKEVKNIIYPTNNIQNFTITSENNYEQYSLVDSFIVEMLTVLNPTQVKTLNDSKYFAGFIMILINIGSRFIDIKFSKNQEHFIKYIFNYSILIIL